MMKSVDFTEKFIKLFNASPCLWDTSLQIYKDKHRKAYALNGIAEQLDISVSLLKKKIHNIRTVYLRQRKDYNIRLQQNIINGISNEGVIEPSWKYYNSMKFLDETLDKKGLTANLPYTNTNVIEEFADYDIKPVLDDNLKIIDYSDVYDTDSQLNDTSTTSCSSAMKRLLTPQENENSLKKTKTSNYGECLQIITDVPTDNVDKKSKYKLYADYISMELEELPKEKADLAIHKINTIIFELKHNGS